MRVRVRVSVEARATLVLPAVARTQHGGHTARTRTLHLGHLARRVSEYPMAGEHLHRVHADVLKLDHVAPRVTPHTAAAAAAVLALDEDLDPARHDQRLRGDLLAAPKGCSKECPKGCS